MFSGVVIGMECRPASDGKIHPLLQHHPRPDNLVSPENIIQGYFISSTLRVVRRLQCHRLGKSTHNAINERPHPLRRCPRKIAHLIPSWSKTTTDTPVRPRAVLSSPKPEAISLAEIPLDINDTNRSRLNASHHLTFTSNRNARTNRHSNSSSQAPPTKSLSPAKCQPFPHNPHIRTTIPTQNMATRAKTLYLRPEL